MMDFAKTIVREGVGLFVDDGSLAAAVVAWLVVAWLASTRAPHDAAWPGIVLAAGLALILVENALRRARRHP